MLALSLGLHLFGYETDESFHHDKRRRLADNEDGVNYVGHDHEIGFRSAYETVGHRLRFTETLDRQDWIGADILLQHVMEDASREPERKADAALMRAEIILERRNTDLTALARAAQISKKLSEDMLVCLEKREKADTFHIMALERLEHFGALG